MGSEEYLLNKVNDVHMEGNHRGIQENYEELKDRYFNPKLYRLINGYCNNCRACRENKYDRKPINKKFHYTATPDGPNEMVHIDIFQIQRTYFLTTIDKFSKLGTAHKLTDKNKVTVKAKIQEREIDRENRKRKEVKIDLKGNNVYIKNPTGFEPQARHKNEIRKVFLRRFPLSGFVPKTLRVNKNCHQKFLKNLSFGGEFKL